MLALPERVLIHSSTFECSVHPSERYKLGYGILVKKRMETQISGNKVENVGATYFLRAYCNYYVAKSLAECYNYTFLNESNRARTYDNNAGLCDDTLYLGWYRFSGEAGRQMADSCVDRYHCGTVAPGWLNGTHPAVADGAVQRQVCFNGGSEGCCYHTTYISVRNCGAFYVYKLNRPNVCDLRYCGNGFIPSTPGRRIQ